MNPIKLRQQILRDTFPDATKEARIQKMWHNYKKSDRLLLTLSLMAIFLSCGILVILFTVYWAVELDRSPLVGLLIVAVTCSMLLFRKWLKMALIKFWMFLVKYW